MGNSRSSSIEPGDRPTFVEKWQGHDTATYSGGDESGRNNSTAPIKVPKKVPTSVELEVAHYTPPCFPMIPIVSQETMSMCRTSWSHIMAPVEKEGQIISGLTLFYTEFYDTLELLDRGKYFEKVLRQHTSGMNSISAKGAIIIRIVNFALALDPDDHTALDLHIKRVGKLHHAFKIRPWMYQTFIQTLMTTITTALGPRATLQEMSAWCHLFALVMQHMLPYAIDGLTLPNEIDANYTGKILDSSLNSKRPGLKRRDSN